MSTYQDNSHPVFILEGSDVPYPPQSKRAGQTRRMIVADYWSSGTGQKKLHATRPSSDDLQGLAESARQSLQRRGGSWIIRYTSPANESDIAQEYRRNLYSMLPPDVQARYVNTHVPLVTVVAAKLSADKEANPDLLLSEWYDSRLAPEAKPDDVPDDVPDDGIPF